MAQVSAEQRAVIELTYYQGCAYREIAEIMGCPVDTVKTRMFHARRRLRQLLADRRQDLP
jgi:RNA polymerase sigma-70 factor (ECF subfamily)